MQTLQSLEITKDFKAKLQGEAFGVVVVQASGMATSKIALRKMFMALS
jgi:hypothetical protein